MPCTLICEQDASRRVEIRFDPVDGRSQKRPVMRLLRTTDGGRTWEEIPTRLLSLWKRIDLSGFWPPDPLDLRRFRFDNAGLEAEIGETAYVFATGGERKWRLFYDEAQRGWRVHDLL